MPRSDFALGLEIADMALDSVQLMSILPKLYNKFFKGPGSELSDEDKVKRLEGLIAAGKVDQAYEETISSWITGLTGADEMRLLRDVCLCIADNMIKPDDGHAFMLFLTNAGKQLRKRFKDGYITEPNRDYRKKVIKILAQLPDDDQRKEFITGAAFMDPTLMDELLEALEGPFESYRAWAEVRLTFLRPRHEVRVQRRKAARASRPKLDGGLRNALGDLFKFRLR